MSRDPDPRTAGSRLLSTRAATAAGWALLAAVGVGGLATTAPVAAGQTGQSGHLPSQGRTGPAAADGALFVGPTAQAVTAAVPTVATAPAMITMAASPARLAFRTSAYAAGTADGRAAVAVRTAMSQIGLPYVWGGNGPTSGDAGFDCSGLTHYAYGVAGIELPRTAHTQFYAGPRVSPGAALEPGDLVFYGTLSRIHHVGMYIGDGRMVNAPTFGKPVQTAYYRWSGDDYVGATRPAATTTGDSSALPFIPETAPPPAPAQPGESDVFVAPPASLPSTLTEPGQTVVPEAQSAVQALDEQQQAGATALDPTTTPTTTVPTPTTTPAPTTAQAAPSVATGSATDPTSSQGAPETTGSGVPLAQGTSLAPPPAVTPATPPPVSTTSAGGSTTTSSSGTLPIGPSPAGPSSAPPPTVPTAPRKPVPAPAKVTTPAPTTSSTPPSSSSSAAAPLVSAPLVSAPVVSAPAVSTAAAAPRPSPVARSTVTFSGAPVPLATTAIGATGLPLRAGVVARPGRPVLRLAAVPVAAGGSVTLKLGAAAPVTYTVASVEVLTTTAAAAVVAAAPAGELVVLVPAADGSWTVLTAT